MTRRQLTAVTMARREDNFMPCRKMIVNVTEHVASGFETFYKQVPRTISGKLLQVFLEMKKKRGMRERETLNLIDVYYFEIMLKITKK